MNLKVDAYFSKAKKWKEEIEQLRSIVLECPVTEELKWGNPCYTYEDINIVLIHVFKEYAALLFFKGALMKDPKGLLIQQTENTQAARQLRFTTVSEISKLKTTIKTYVKEAIAVEKAGLKVEFKTAAEFAVPEEFQIKLKQEPALKKAFEALTPGRQKAYLLHFSAAKQVKTRESRVEKAIPQILDGKGLDD
ncbi:MAG: YdeI/OmpD-associated family protein [Burkholderiales bacterium]|nr:YdeI/OmpD-associated family protein [Burkholderiales bacterium]MBI3728074.1 YdeI/OmpD-associated family protein [Burkholderiales bacterium]